MSREKDNAPKLSEYANTLDPLVKKRYMQKIACIEVDPFLISYQNYDAECLPPAESIDLVSYLVLETSYYTKEQLIAFKSLQAYNQLVSGFVQSVHGLIIAGKHVVLAKVRHSQKMNDPTVPLWIIAEDDGRILFAHCRGCMAGQGETCSHIASVLFYIETFNRIRGKLACTDKQCAWILPTYSKDIPFAEVQDIDFRSATKLKQKLDETVEKLDANAPIAAPPPQQVKVNGRQVVWDSLRARGGSEKASTVILKSLRIHSKTISGLNSARN